MKLKQKWYRSNDCFYMGYCLVPNSNREATHILLACNISAGNFQYFG